MKGLPYHGVKFSFTGTVSFPSPAISFEYLLIQSSFLILAVQLDKIIIMKSQPSEPLNNEDQELVECAKTGNSEAFEKIFRKYKGKIYSVAFRYLHNPEEASDAVQETFIDAFKFLYAFRGKSSLSTWLVRICLNRCWHNRKKRQEQLSYEVPLDKEIDTGRSTVKIELADISPMPHEEVERRQELAHLMKAIDSLKKKHREIIVLKDLEGYSYEECAGILSISEGTVMSRLHRARKNLLKKLRSISQNIHKDNV